MKLSKARSDWVKQLVEESTARERDELERKEEAMMWVRFRFGGVA